MTWELQFLSFCRLFLNFFASKYFLKRFFFNRLLKGPKREIRTVFGSGVFGHIRPVWVDDLGTRPKNPKFWWFRLENRHFVLSVLSLTSLKHLSALLTSLKDFKRCRRKHWQILSAAVFFIAAGGSATKLLALLAISLKNCKLCRPQR